MHLIEGVLDTRDGLASGASQLDGVASTDITLDVSSASIRVVATIVPQTHAIAAAAVEQINQFTPDSLEAALGNGMQVVFIEGATISIQIVNINNVYNTISSSSGSGGLNAAAWAGPLLLLLPRAACRRSIV